MVGWTFLSLLTFSCAHLLAEENFYLINGITGDALNEIGPNIQKRVTPCSTFKIALSLIGYNEGILEDEKSPIWNFQESYVHFLESWKASQTPRSWMSNSCVWYSQVLMEKLGLEKVQIYLTSFKYGNQNLSGGLHGAWLSSSLEISAKEQVDFLVTMLRGELLISDEAFQKTKSLLYIEDLSGGWKMFGKTGMGSNGDLAIGWFVGWVEKEHMFFPFAYNLCERQVDPSLRILRVKRLLQESNFIDRLEGECTEEY